MADINTMKPNGKLWCGVGKLFGKKLRCWWFWGRFCEFGLLFYNDLPLFRTNAILSTIRVTLLPQFLYIIRFAKKPWCSKTNLPSHSRYIIKGWNLRLITLTMHHFRKFSTRISRIQINKIHIKNIKKTLIKYSNWLQL